MKEQSNMSDELAPAPEEIQDTPAEAAPVEDGTPAPDSEYTPERARGLHAELTKAQQEMAEFNRLRERARSGDAAALQELTGYTFAEDDEEVPDPGDDEADPLSAIE